MSGIGFSLLEKTRKKHIQQRRLLNMTGNDHALEAADPLELAEIKRRWESYINQLPDYAYLCKDLLNGKM